LVIRIIYNARIRNVAVAECVPIIPLVGYVLQLPLDRMIALVAGSHPTALSIHCFVREACSARRVESDHSLSKGAQEKQIAASPFAGFTERVRTVRKRVIFSQDMLVNDSALARAHASKVLDQINGLGVQRLEVGVSALPRS
jgi:hypothetical protein